MYLVADQLLLALSGDLTGSQRKIAGTSILDVLPQKTKQFATSFI